MGQNHKRGILRRISLLPDPRRQTPAAACYDAMPSKAWMIARAASRAATESRAAAAAASRGSAVAAVTRPPTRYDLPRTPPVTPAGRLFNLDMRSDKEGMPFDVKDLESEQTLWALYNRWCTYFNMARSSVDKDYRFNIFKEKARLIYELKGADPKNLELNHLSDVSIDELCPPKFFRRRY